MEDQLKYELGILVFVLILARILYLIHKITTGFSREATSKRTLPCKTIVCIGSGGHTTEMLTLLNTLTFSKYSPRTQTFSLSGKILMYFADNFLVQWPSLKQRLKRAEYIGQLM
ncbi:hypothetical protein Zmor_005667 [Zophobas morio]|uniref:UDP-N-acetylglucosamine transferase subunit ALG14 n=1 Tax=Zophobas morio TaxID=2755281 RepID=A0AA38ITQ4_9CUCU|nr:hypothetical protein Zmor_005667 [Zophobas morio]